MHHIECQRPPSDHHVHLKAVAFEDAVAGPIGKCQFVVEKVEIRIGERCMKQAMKRAGAATTSANRIALLRDTDGDGIADIRRTFAEGLNSPFGMTLSRGTLYVANTDALVAFRYSNGQTRVTKPEKIVDLPAGSLNHHWTKDVIASPDGRKLYVTVGSNSNVGENGMVSKSSGTP